MEEQERQPGDRHSLPAEDNCPAEDHNFPVADHNFLEVAGRHDGLEVVLGYIDRVEALDYSRSLAAVADSLGCIGLVVEAGCSRSPGSDAALGHKAAEEADIHLGRILRLILDEISTS